MTNVVFASRRVFGRAASERSRSLLRLAIEPSEEHGLRAPSQLMIDKITTVSKNKLEIRVGRLSVEDIVRLNRVVLVFLGLAGSAPRQRDSD